MSYPPPPPGQGPQNPYGAPPPGQQPGQPQGQQAYGYPGQGGQPQQPGYAYPQQGGYPGYPGYPAYPGGPGGPGIPQMARMPGIVIAARVLLFVAGALWALGALSLFLFGLAASDSDEFSDTTGLVANDAVGIIVLFGLLFAGLSALHIVSASLFGRGRMGTRIMAIIAGAVNCVLPVLGIIGAAANRDVNPGVGILWAATAIVTVVFCSLPQAGAWFNRPRY